MKIKIKSSPRPSSRRLFMKNLIFLTSSATIASVKPVSGKEKNDRLKKGEMYYRRLGRTNLFISEISLGGSPVPEEALLHQVIERGVNYIDTSCTYMNGNSERLIGKLCKSIGRDKVYVGTKFHLRGNWNEESILNSVNRSLQRLR